MSHQHFNLKYVPFSKSSQLLITEDLQLLKNKFNQLLQVPGIGVLTGDPGVGKTAALRHITNDLNPHQHQIIYLSETQFTHFDIYRQIAWHLGLVPRHRFADLWRDIKNQIRELVKNKCILPIFIIDEAQNLPMDFFKAFPSFLNFDFDARDMMTVWFVGQPMLNAIINRQAYTALSSRVQINYHMRDVYEREIFSQIIQDGFKSAGAVNKILSDPAIEVIRIASHGKFRYVYRILYTAMQLASEKQLNHISDEIIHSTIALLKNNSA